MTETTLPPASRYQDGSEKTITIDGVSVTYRVMGGEWVKVSETDIRTIVVPAGQSFRIVDDAENPTFEAGLYNRSLSETDIIFGFIKGDTVSFIQINDSGEMSNNVTLDNGTGSVQQSLSLAADGSSEYTNDSQVVKFSGNQTHADNAAALAAGLPVGADYNTPAGVRMVVIPGE